MTNHLITHRLPIDYSLMSLMPLMSSISYTWSFELKFKIKIIFLDSKMLFFIQELSKIPI